MRINVTGNIIEAANLLKNKNTYLACFNPVALALNKDTNYSGWFTTSDTVLSLCTDKTFTLPSKAIKFIADWEEGKKVKPFSFTLNI